MSATKKYALIYSLENESQAEDLMEDLRNQGHEVQLFGRGDDDIQKPIDQLKLPSQASVLMLVTDNYLKSAGCMYGVLPATRSWSGSDRLIPIVTDGTGVDGERVPTNFGRVSDIIQYMNFWQDKYLEFRKEKRQQEEDATLDHRIEVTKLISADVGELLRFLRGVNCFTPEAFRKEFLPAGDEAPGERTDEEELPEGGAIMSPADPDDSVNDEDSLIKYIENSGEELMAENTELDNPYTIENMGDEMDEEMLSEIPGMNLLSGKEIETSSTVNLDELINGEEKHQDSTRKDKSRKDRVKSARGKSGNPDTNEDDEESELNAILNEVLQDDSFDKQGDDPDGPDEFDLDSLFEGEDEVEDEPPAKTKTTEEPEVVAENEIQEVTEADQKEEEENLNQSNGMKSTPEEVLEKAINFFGDEKKEEGIGYLREAVTGSPQDTTLRYYYAYALARYIRDFNAAMEQLDILLKEDDQHPDAWFLKAELAENQQDFETARASFEQVANFQPEYPEIHYRLGLLTAQHFEGEDRQAATYFRKAIKYDRENADAQYMLASILNERLDTPEKAAKHFNKTLKIHPEHPFANYDLALLHYKLGEKDLAAEYYKNAIAVNPELRTEQNDAAFGYEPESGELATEDVLEASGSTNAETGEKKATEQEQDEIKKVALKTVLITGATAGIGAATAHIFAKNGYRVIATGRRNERLEEMQREFSESYNNDIQILPFDVRESREIESALSELPDEFKQVDILINNAGLSRGLGPIHKGKLENWDTMIDTNIKGLLYLTRAVSPQMVERRSGHIINVASNAGKEVYPGGNVYCATKAAVDALTKAMRLDLYEHNVRVSQVAPGHVEETEFARVRFDGDAEKAAKVYDNFQPLKSSDVAEAIFFIATRPAYVNIQDITMFGTQQAGSNFISRSGRPDDES